jgi:alkanesulfonate monooxygenase SsuD/methylene tetrahydromethanopterin reductase-like flavin-dependent oxidoreductase (luciferase family)
MGLYPRLFELAGVGEDATTLDLDQVRAMSVSGNAGDCARMVRALGDAGADSVIVVPRHEDHDEQVARFAAEVMPALR